MSGGSGNRAGRRRHGIRSAFDQEMRRATRAANITHFLELQVRAKNRPAGAIPTSGRARSDAKRNQRLAATAEQATP